MKIWLPALLKLQFKDIFSKRNQTEKQKIGKIGEDAALRYLTNKGWRCISRNLRLGYDELDILAISHDEKTLAIVEVRSTTQKERFPERTIGEKKRRAMLRVAKKLRTKAKRHRCQLRVDLITVRISTEGNQIEHFEDVLRIMNAKAFG